jgi:hypothetical protein
VCGGEFFFSACFSVNLLCERTECKNWKSLRRIIRIRLGFISEIAYLRVNGRKESRALALQSGFMGKQSFAPFNDLKVQLWMNGKMVSFSHGPMWMGCNKMFVRIQSIYRDDDVKAPRMNEFSKQRGNRR